MRVGIVVLVGVLGLLVACGPTSHRHPDDEWGEGASLDPTITGDNAKDEARWRHELASDKWDDDTSLLTDDPPRSANEYQALDEDIPPLDFVGPPAPPTKWESWQKGSTKFGRVMFSVLTVFVTLGMMAAPYLLMI
jgi:hypothetical protein